MRENENLTRVLLITGMSGAGKSTMLHALEDMSYEAVDNLPLNLLPQLLKTADDAPSSAPHHPIAIGFDSRTRGFQPEKLKANLDELQQRKDLDISLVFLDCAGEVLQRRFTETRRRHPLALDRTVSDGIAAERQLMENLRHRADYIVDTSDLNVHDLRHLTQTRFRRGPASDMAIVITSFSYRRGLPRDADLVFDMRFLVNPYYNPDLRNLTGRDPRVAAFVETDPNFAEFFHLHADLILSLLPRYKREGKSYLTIAFGCTGGKHRSVHLAERMGALLSDHGYPARIVHRDVNRQGA